MTSLHDIGKHHRTDKAEFHGYLGFYEKLLKPIRNKPITMLEIGVAGGESILMWQDWFTQPTTMIYGVDIEDRPLPKFDERVAIIVGDASNPNMVFDITNRTGLLDLVIDDGSHHSGQQKDSLRLLWPNLKSGGLYIVEDCSTSYSLPWTSPEEVSFVRSLDAWIDEVMEKGKDHCGRPTDSTIEEIIVRKSVVVLKKR